MKAILYICTEAAPGLVAYATGILLSAAASGKVAVYALTVDDEKVSYRPYLKAFPPDHIHFLRMPEKKTCKIVQKLYKTTVLREAKKMCAAHHIDFIHLLTVDYTCATIFRRLKKIRPVYYTVHDVTPHEKAYTGMKDYFFSTYIKWGVKRMMQQADYVVTNSKSQYQHLKAIVPYKNICFQLFPPLITATILTGDQTCPELQGIDRYVLFFGNIDKYKGIEYLHEAFINNRQLLDYRLVIAGKGPVYFPHTGDPRVVFINRHIADEEIKSLYTRASCVVYPYISATQSGVLTIAYKFNTPALVSDIPFFREVSDEKTCLFFRRADIADLSDKLETLLLHTDTAAMKAAQKKYFENNYAEKAVSASVSSIYHTF